MVRYVIEKRESARKPAPDSEKGDVNFSIHELPTRKQVGTLLKMDGMFMAESKKHRNTSEASRGLLVLKMAFRSDDFFIEQEGSLKKVTEDDLH